MSKSRNKNRSEVEYLKGLVRQLKKELQYYRKREHLFEDPTEEVEEPEIVENRCPSCKKGQIIEWDFTYAVLRRCTGCTFEQRQKKKG